MPGCIWPKVEKNQAEWRRRRQQWSQHGRHVASVREDCTDRSSPPPARLDRSVDIELGAPRTATTLTEPPAAAQPPARSLLGRASTLTCRVLLLDGEQITVQVEVIGHGVNKFLRKLAATL